MENKRKHLEIIQGVINRLAGNSFYIKGWTITLLTAVLALSIDRANPDYIFINLFVIIAFWILDSFFLSRERCYRDLYDHVRVLDEKDVDYSMNSDEYRKIKKNRWISALFSRTLLIFYLSLIIIASSIYCFVK